MPAGIYLRTREHNLNISRAKKGKKYHRPGYKHSEETKEKIRKALLVNNGMRGRHRTEDERQRISATIRSKYKNGLIKNGMQGVSHPNHLIGKIFYKNILMRSTWEANVAKKLDEIGIGWLYEPKRFFYHDCSYLPDFYLFDFDIWIEVKGWMERNLRDKILIEKFINESKQKLILIEGSRKYKEFIETSSIDEMICGVIR